MARFGTEPETPWMLVRFSNEPLAYGDGAAGGGSLKYLARFLKPEYRHAFDPVSAR